jgi:fructose-1,6-bisphosphatase/inositol monophosphatase family enzyme
MDIIDGTDLLLRQLGNWCSAIVFYYPPEKEILLALVVDHEGNIFYATRDPGSPAYFLPRDYESLRDSVSLHVSTGAKDREDACIRFFRNRSSGPLSNVSLANASICFVGQKPSSFLAAAENQKLCAKLGGYDRMLKDLDHRRSQGEKELPAAPSFRFYNFGGIPMMPKVANGIIDAVVGFRPPKPHDLIAGAFIALKAGAHIGDLKGNDINEADLANWINHPDGSTSSYIISCTRPLYEELLGCFS